jgi:hypothetical protein
MEQTKRPGGPRMSTRLRLGKEVLFDKISQLEKHQS